MMRLIKSISNCSGIKCVEERLLQAINGEVFIDELGVPSLDSVDLINGFQGTLNYTVDSSLIEIEKKSINQTMLIRIDEADNLSRLTEELFLVHNRLSRRELKYSVVDDAKDVIWEFEGNQFIKGIQGRLLVTNRLSKEEFWLLNSSGIELFHYILPLGFNVFKAIEVVNDTLFFMSNKDGNSYKNVTGVDINTGEVKWNYEYSVPYETNFIATTLHEKFTYGLSSKFYQVFDPVKGEFLVEINVEKSLPEGVSPDVNRQSVADGRLWFVSGRGNEASFGAFDIDKSEIDFVQSHPLSEEDQFDTPVYHEGKLYLRTLHSNTLHIFEKE